MALFNKKADKSEANASVIDNIRAAETLVQKINDAITVKQSDVDRLVAVVAALALQIADGADPKSVDAKLDELTVARRDLQILAAAVGPAAERLAQAHRDQRAHSMAGHVATCRKFNVKRLQAATAMTSAIETLDTAWRTFHEATTALSLAWPNGSLPQASLTANASIERAFAHELFRLGGRPALLGGQNFQIPSLPGAAPPEPGRSIDPSTVKPLAVEVEAANQVLLGALTGQKSEPVTLMRHTDPSAHGRRDEPELPPPPSGPTNSAAQVTASLPKVRMG